VEERNVSDRTETEQTKRSTWLQAERSIKFEEISKPVMAVDYMIWKHNLWIHLYSTKPYREFLQEHLTWTTGKNRGFWADEDGAVVPQLTGREKAETLDSILMEIENFAPKSIFMEIYMKLTSYENIFTAIRKSCTFPVEGAHWM
jgi:hypothetical protein